MSFRVFPAIAAVALLVPVAAVAQNFSEGYQFLDAIKKGDGAKVDEILSKPGSTIINTKDRDTGQGALHIVADRGDRTYLLFLLQHGANPNITDRQGNTPLIIAVSKGFTDGVTILLSHGASINQANDSGETPLNRAVQLRDVDMIRTLLDKGADPDKADVIAGMSARDYARADARTPGLAKLLADAPKLRKDGAVAGPRL